MNLNVYRCDGAAARGRLRHRLRRAGQSRRSTSWCPTRPGSPARRDRLVGLVITHAHEDHIGAVAHLWPQLRCPIYRHALRRGRAAPQAGRGRAARTRCRSWRRSPPARASTSAPSTCEFIRVAHSIPEAQALAIRTRHGTVLHTGDWKLDPDPLIGPPTDEAAFAALGEEGVLAMVCDCTNAMVEGHSGSEAEVRRNLAALIRGLKGRVAVTCFASNVARRRIHRAGRAARRGGRSRCSAASCATSRPRRGNAATSTAIPPFVPEERGRLPAGRRAAADLHRQPGRAALRLAKIAADTHPQHRAGGGRHGDLLLPHDPGQRARHPAHPGRAGAPRLRGDDRRRPHGPCLRPSGAGRAEAALCRW